jgi:hypothetical protein
MERKIRDEISSYREALLRHSALENYCTSPRGDAPPTVQSPVLAHLGWLYCKSALSILDLNADSVHHARDLEPCAYMRPLEQMSEAGSKGVKLSLTLSSHTRSGCSLPR